mmetsp:Transcript_11126/g.20860  ORF Transcript_11126/g.20860 Transcript_11126/m.20860 type:complete len:140 (+) Transcript_11126:1586-2005(+)
MTSPIELRHSLAALSDQSTNHATLSLHALKVNAQKLQKISLRLLSIIPNNINIIIARPNQSPFVHHKVSIPKSTSMPLTSIANDRNDVRTLWHFRGSHQGSDHVHGGARTDEQSFMTKEKVGHVNGLLVRYGDGVIDNF